jgi:hypothetical protein
MLIVCDLYSRSRRDEDARVSESPSGGRRVPPGQGRATSGGRAVTQELSCGSTGSETGLQEIRRQMIAYLDGSDKSLLDDRSINEPPSGADQGGCFHQVCKLYRDDIRPVRNSGLSNACLMLDIIGYLMYVMYGSSSEAVSIWCYCSRSSHCQMQA